MTNPKRFFMVKVTGCLTGCPDFGGINRCRHESLDDSHEQKAIFLQNKDQLTNSCPLYGQSQEEKK